MATPTERIELKIIFKINSRVFNKLYKHLDTFLSYEDKCKAYDSVEVSVGVCVCASVCVSVFVSLSEYVCVGNTNLVYVCYVWMYMCG